MNYIEATEKNTDEIVNLVENTILTVYPKYYPNEVVNFFCKLHSKENILNDIKNRTVGILIVDNNIVGTGCYNENHITRVYVNPLYQKNGYGSYIIQCLENIIREKYDTVYLDASLPASHLYEKLGYSTIEHKKHTLENDVVLVYEVMEKSLYQLKALNESNFELMKNFFRDIFTKEPWNDDWSNENQLTAYIKDISCCFNSINYGFFKDEQLIALSMGNKRHWWGGTEYFIDEFCVKTDFQGKGIGKKFLKAIEEDIKEHGMTQIYLQTERNVPAYHFYKKSGFNELTDHISFFKEV